MLTSYAFLGIPKLLMIHIGGNQKQCKMYCLNPLCSKHPYAALSEVAMTQNVRIEFACSLALYSFCKINMY